MLQFIALPVRIVGDRREAFRKNWANLKPILRTRAALHADSRNRRPKGSGRHTLLEHLTCFYRAIKPGTGKSYEIQ
jgi:hypothetical protein